MSDHFEKIVQMLDKQNHRFDQIEESIGAMFTQIVKIEQNQNRLIRTRGKTHPLQGIGMKARRRNRRYFPWHSKVPRCTVLTEWTSHI